VEGRAAASEPVELEHPDGRVRVEPRPDGRVEVTVVDEAPGTYVSQRSCATDYPLPLIERVLAVKGPGYLCDEIQREQDPEYVELFLRYGLLGFVPAEEFAGARILDFGSGSGASTVVLARMFPEAAEILGSELVDEFIELARMRAEHYGLGNCRFYRVPDPDRLPDDLGTFRFVNVGATYEHLLPDERRRLMPQLWSVLEPGGVLFVNQLPYRWYPIEHHTTGLPGLNYLPASLAQRVALARSGRLDGDEDWPTLLRAGIRGGSEREIRRDIERGGGVAESIVPRQLGLRSHADLWYAYSNGVNPHPVKRGMRAAFRAIHAATGTNFLPSLSLAFRKRG
jgi:SAM-dependent methyltransferase